jgi:SnoaL-like domain
MRHTRGPRARGPGKTTHMTHAFITAIEARDAGGVVDTLAPDVVLYSAVTLVPFEGRDVVADTYRSVLESFEELRVVDEFESGDTHAFFWEGRMGGRPVSGADRIRLDPEGKVREITVLGRPMSGVATFLTEIGFRLARRRRGRVVAWLLRLTSLPLPPLLSLLDPVTRRVVR